jgi:hypothetical protein
MNAANQTPTKQIVTARSRRYATKHSQQMQKARDESLDHTIARAVEEITATMKPNHRTLVAKTLTRSASGFGPFDKICPGMSAMMGKAVVEAMLVGFKLSKLTVDGSPAERRRAEKLLRSHAAGTAGNIAKGNRTKSRVEEAFRAATAAKTDVNVEAIATELGVSVGTVYRHLRTLK